jgi:hypothetical protein
MKVCSCVLILSTTIVAAMYIIIFSFAGAEVCVDCEAGYYRLTGTECLKCDNRTISAAGSAACTTCDEGTFSNSANTVRSML